MSAVRFFFGECCCFAVQDFLELVTLLRNPPGIPNPLEPAPDQKPKPEPKPEENNDPTAPCDVEVVLQGWQDPELLKQPVPLIVRFGCSGC